jgi:hypothetical protein
MRLDRSRAFLSIQSLEIRASALPVRLRGPANSRNAHLHISPKSACWEEPSWQIDVWASQLSTPAFRNVDHASAPLLRVPLERLLLDVHPPSRLVLDLYLHAVVAALPCRIPFRPARQGIALLSGIAQGVRVRRV